MVLHICQFPLSTLDIVLDDPVPVDNQPPMIASFEQDSITFAPLGAIKTTRYIENYFEEQPMTLRDTSYTINISTVVDLSIRGQMFQKYHVVIPKLTKFCLQMISNTELNLNAFFQNIISLQYEHVLTNKTDIIEIQKDMMFRETIKQNIVEYVSEQDLIAFQIHTPRTTLMTHEPPFYFIDTKRHLILTGTQVLGVLVKTKPALNTCTLYIPFGIYFEELCIKTCIDTFRRPEFNMNFDTRLCAWMFDSCMSLFILDEYLFKRLIKRCSNTMIKFVSEITDINDIVYPLKQHVIIRYDVLKKMYFKFMNIHSNNWTPLLHGNNEMIYRAHQNRQIDTSVPFMINLFQMKHFVNKLFIQIENIYQI